MKEFFVILLFVLAIFSIVPSSCDVKSKAVAWKGRQEDGHPHKKVGPVDKRWKMKRWIKDKLDKIGLVIKNSNDDLKRWKLKQKVKVDRFLKNSSNFYQRLKMRFNWNILKTRRRLKMKKDELLKIYKAKQAKFKESIIRFWKRINLKEYYDRIKEKITNVFNKDKTDKRTIVNKRRNRKILSADYSLSKDINKDYKNDAEKINSFIYNSKENKDVVLKKRKRKRKRKRRSIIDDSEEGNSDSKATIVSSNSNRNLDESPNNINKHLNRKILSADYSLSKDINEDYKNDAEKINSFVYNSKENKDIVLKKRKRRDIIEGSKEEENPDSDGIINSNNYNRNVDGGSTNNTEGGSSLNYQTNYSELAETDGGLAKKIVSRSHSRSKTSGSYRSRTYGQPLKNVKSGTDTTNHNSKENTRITSTGDVNQKRNEELVTLETYTSTESKNDDENIRKEEMVSTKEETTGKYYAPRVEINKNGNVDYKADPNQEPDQQRKLKTEQPTINVDQYTSEERQMKEEPSIRKQQNRRTTLGPVLSGEVLEAGDPGYYSWHTFEEADEFTTKSRFDVQPKEPDNSEKTSIMSRAPFKIVKFGYKTLEMFVKIIWKFVNFLFNG